MKHLTLNAQIPTKAVDEESTLNVIFASELFFFLRQHRKKKSTFSDGVK